MLIASNVTSAGAVCETENTLTHFVQGLPPELHALRERLSPFAEKAKGPIPSRPERRTRSVLGVVPRGPRPATPATLEAFIARPGALVDAPLLGLHRGSAPCRPTRRSHTQEADVAMALRTLWRGKAIQGEARQAQASPLNYTHLETARVHLEIFRWGFSTAST